MTDTILLVKDADGTTKSLKVSDVGLGILEPYHLEDTTQRAALLAAFAALGTEVTLAAVLAALGPLATQTTLAAVLAKLSADPATQTTLAAVLAKLTSDPATQTTLAAVLAKLTADPSTATGQAASLAATNLIGTRAYSTSGTRVTVSGTSAQSAAITATEVTMCFVGTAGTYCYVRTGSNPTATTNDMPLIAGALVTRRITSGDKIAAIQDTTGGFLNFVPVA